MKRQLIVASLFTACLACGVPALADSTDALPTASIEDLRARLNLTPEQEAKIAPFAEQRKAKMQEVRSKMSSATTPQDKRAALMEAKSAQDEFTRNVEPLLTKEQQAEWEKIREEGRAQFKERLLNR